MCLAHGIQKSAKLTIKFLVITIGNVMTLAQFGPLYMIPIPTREFAKMSGIHMRQENISKYGLRSSGHKLAYNSQNGYIQFF